MKTVWPWVLAGVTLVAAFASLFRGEVQAARDLSAHVFPETFFLLERWRTGSVPLWLPNARLGQPFAALLYTQVFYVPRVVTGLLFGHVLGPNVMHLFHAGWAFAGSWFAARRLGLSARYAFFAAAPFAFSPFFVEFAQNLSFASGAAWAGWTLWAAEGLRRAPSLRSCAWLAASLGAAFHAGSPEMWLWQVLLAGFVLVATPRSLRWGALAVVWAGALAAVVALPALELSRTWTQPGAAPAGSLEWSTSAAQLLSIFVPDGDLPREGAWWGGVDQRFFFTLFTGSLAMGLTVLGVRVRRARPVLAVVVLLLVLAVGRHFFLGRWLLAVPPFSLFRYPAKYLAGVLFGASLLAGFGARRLGALSRRGLHAPLAAWVGGVVGLALASRWSWVRAGFHDGVPWLIGATVLLVLFHRRPRVLAVLLAAELLLAPVAKWARLPASALERPSVLAPSLRAEGRLSLRVDLDDHDFEACGPWDREDHDTLLDGRDRLSALRFVEDDLRAVGGYGFRDPWRLGAAFSRGAGAYAVAGVSTFVRETWAPPPAGARQVALSPLEDVWLWKGAPALPRGFFVTTVRVANDDAAFDALSAPTEELGRAVVVDHGAALIGAPCAAAVTTLEISPERVEQTLKACGDGAVVLADAWYPGWSVEVDGAPAEVLRAWGFVRAVRVPAGAQRIVWTYRPLTFQVGAGCSALGLLALLGAAVRRREVAA